MSESHAFYGEGRVRAREISGFELAAEERVLLAEEGAAVEGGDFVRGASGLYTSRRWWSRGAVGSEAGWPYFHREELRLDVDGHHPQQTASGAVFDRFARRAHWIAKLERIGRYAWRGVIWHREGRSFPYTALRIYARPARMAAVVFLQPGARPEVVWFRYRSPRFHQVEFEYDHTDDSFASTEIETHAHPNRPPGLPAERLSISSIYERAGFGVRLLPEGEVPVARAGADGVWSDLEMHDAMQSYWSRFDDRPQWSLWVLFARLHERGTGLGGIMFDDIGSNHRQGTALFNESFIQSSPAGDPAPDAWVARMRFWTACHEMGHAFNLAHSWQKSLGTPWIPLPDEPEARSFMNYPYNVDGGETAFFSDFEFRFSDPELLFMRHAPFEYVQMGNAEWFDQHGFRQADASPQPRLRLELRLNRRRPVLQYLEPAVLELKLTNVSGAPQIVDRRILESQEHVTLVVKRDGSPARQHLPFARACFAPDATVLGPGESLYESFFAGASRQGWLLAEAGTYTVQAALHLGDEDVVSVPLRVRVERPADEVESRLAQDFFSSEVGRVLAFDGSRQLGHAVDVLREVRDRLAHRRVATHARIALANVMVGGHKELVIGGGAAERGAAAELGLDVRVSKGDAEAAQEEYQAALGEHADDAAETLGHIDYHYYANRFCDWLAREGEEKQAGEQREQAVKTLVGRGVPAAYLEAPDKEVVQA